MLSKVRDVGGDFGRASITGKSNIKAVNHEAIDFDFVESKPEQSFTSEANENPMDDSD